MGMHERGATNSTEERALALLGSGLGTEVVASALGVTPAAISQLLSQKDFAESVAFLKFQNLTDHTERDKTYDGLEDALLEKFQKLLPMMYRPMEVLKAITVINAAKRRGASAPEHAMTQSTVVNLILPTQIFHKFTTNSANQVIEAGIMAESVSGSGAQTQQLLTMQSGSLLEATKRRLAAGSEKPLNERTYDGVSTQELRTESGNKQSNG